MRAITLKNFGDPDVLMVTEIPEPTRRRTIIIARQNGRIKSCRPYNDVENIRLHLENPYFRIRNCR